MVSANGSQWARPPVDTLNRHFETLFSQFGALKVSRRFQNASRHPVMFAARIYLDFVGEWARVLLAALAGDLRQVIGRKSVAGHRKLPSNVPLRKEMLDFDREPAVASAVKLCNISSIANALGARTFYSGHFSQPTL